jgi:hypothetical protein
MEPAILPHSILVLDRHYTSLTPYRPPQPSLYAIQRGNVMLFRYATIQGVSIILRPLKLDHPVELIELKPEASTAAHIVGRVCVSISEL